MKKIKTETTKKTTIDKNKLFAEAVKNSIKVHGILLEYETQKLLNDSLVKIGFHIKKNFRSHLIPWRDQQGVTHTSEIDVFLETVYTKLDILTDIFKNNQLQDEIYRPALYMYFLAQCKGHDKEGFLLANSSESPEIFKLPICTYQDLYRDSPQLIEKQYYNPSGMYFVDWAYFYTGEMQDWNSKQQIKIDKLKTFPEKPVFKQDKVSNSNKFLGAVEQINESLDCFMGTRPLCKHTGMMQLIIPIIVTNANIFLMEHGGNKVAVYKNIPWIVYVNKQKDQSQFAHLPFYDNIFVVNSTYIPGFCAAIQSLIMGRATLFIEGGIQYETGDKILITEFDV